MKPGSRFTFAGRTLEFVRLHDLTLWVKLARGTPNTVPRWAGGRMPLSTELSRSVRAKLDAARHGNFDDPELHRVKPILDLQAKWSAIPADDELLIESLSTRNGHHLYCYHSKDLSCTKDSRRCWPIGFGRKPRTFTISVNDYGFELVSPDAVEMDEFAWRELLATAGLTDDILESLNAGELAKRQFREVARVAGLIQSGRGGPSAKQLQASSGLFYEVFREHDPGNLLLWQARGECPDRQFEVTP